MIMLKYKKYYNFTLELLELKNQTILESFITLTPTFWKFIKIEFKEDALSEKNLFEIIPFIKNIEIYSIFINKLKLNPLFIVNQYADLTSTLLNALSFSELESLLNFFKYNRYKIDIHKIVIGSSKSIYTYFISCLLKNNYDIDKKIIIERFLINMKYDITVGVLENKDNIYFMIVKKYPIDQILYLLKGGYVLSHKSIIFIFENIHLSYYKNVAIALFNFKS